MKTMRTYICTRIVGIITVSVFLITANTQSRVTYDENPHVFLGKRAVIKSLIAEMNNSFPPPILPAASPNTKRCPRAHQGLYNEIVDCLEENGESIKIAYNSIIYGFDDTTKKALNSFWTHKKHITMLEELDADILNAIPNRQYGEEPTIVLVYPWKTFSVGTRFKHLPECDTPTSHAIVWADYTTQTVRGDFVPREHALQEMKRDPQSMRKLFVKIAQDLVDKSTCDGQDNVIPYVWGGSSFVQAYKRDAFYQEDGTWHREGPHDPYTGYDCSEFVMRMAHIAGIEFPWKTTTMIQRSLRELNGNDLLEEGDLIWVQGHVAIVSNIERNEIIEARGYSCGYGCVHCITLAECFDGITTYADLLEHYHANKPIQFKDKQGKPYEKSSPFKVLKLVD